MTEFKELHRDNHDLTHETLSEVERNGHYSESDQAIDQECAEFQARMPERIANVSTHAYLRTMPLAGPRPRAYRRSCTPVDADRGGAARGRVGQDSDCY